MDKYQILDIALRMVVAIILVAVVAACLFATKYIDIQSIVGCLLTVLMLPVAGGAFSAICYLIIITMIDIMNN